MLDSDLKPWLLEVNISPSFSSSSPFDKNLKTKLACDAFTLVGVRPANHRAAEERDMEEARSILRGGHRPPIEETEEEIIEKIKQINVNKPSELE